MPRLEAYYHDGNTGKDEPHSNRTDVKAANKLTDKIRMGTGEQIKAQRQKQWMNINNPALWDGDIDFD